MYEPLTDEERQKPWLSSTTHVHVLKDLACAALDKRLLNNVDVELMLNWLFNITINDISVIYVTAHRCAGGLKKKLDLRSGSQRHRHFVGFFNVPVLAPTRDQPFYTVIPTHRPI